MIFNRLFGGSGGSSAPAVAVVRNVTIGRQVRVDPLAWRALEGTRFHLDRDTLEITAQGLIKLDEGGYVHRFYTDDELMLQAVSQTPDGSDADDFTLFQPWSSSYPTVRADTELFVHRLSQPVWDEPEIGRYDRFWYEGDDRPQPPIQLWEAIYHERTGAPVRHVRQNCMLFAREVAPEGQELLLALAMQPEDGDLTHEIMIGLAVSPGEFTA
nr:DUF2491 family protein [uncultured Sphingosinicella sp.]